MILKLKSPCTPSDAPNASGSSAVSPRAITPSPPPDARSDAPANTGTSVANARHGFFRRLGLTSATDKAIPDTVQKLFAKMDSFMPSGSPPTMDNLRIAVAPVPVHEDSRSNEFFQFYSTLPFTLPGSVAVKRLDARVKEGSDEVSMLTLSLEGAPADKAVLERHYGPLHLQLPGDGMTTTFFSTDKEGVKLHFGYGRDRPDLLMSVVMDFSERPK